MTFRVWLFVLWRVAYVAVLCWVTHELVARQSFGWVITGTAASYLAFETLGLVGDMRAGARRVL